MTPGEGVIEDYRHLALSLKAHPVSFLRAALTRKGILRNEDLPGRANPLPGAPPRAGVAEGREGGARRKQTRVTVSGLVLVRQRPGSAKGVIFMTLEDETGTANIIVWPKVFEILRPIVIGARFLSVTGRLQSESGVIHVVAETMEDLTPMMGTLARRGVEVESIARADEVRHPQHPRDRNEVVQARRVLPKGRNFQ
jgi:DNA polymerase III alpha subunit